MVSMLEPKTQAEFKEMVKKPVVLVQWSAEFCGPCKMIKGPLREGLQKFTDKCEFVYVDLAEDELEDLQEEYEVEGMPTFQVFKDGNAGPQLTSSKVDPIVAWVEQNL